MLNVDEIIILIICISDGPDSIVFQPDNNRPSAVEGNVLPNIVCSSECYPGCSETWWNVTENTQQGNGNTLSLGTVYRYHTGAYNCSSTNQADQFSKTLSRSVYITVQCKYIYTQQNN